MNKRMHIRGIHVVFLIPGRRRQDDIGVEAGARQAEVEGNHQIQLAVEAVIMPLDLFRLHAALLAQIFTLNAVLGTQQVLQHILMAFPGGAKQVRAPDEEVARMVFAILRLLGRKADSALFQRFNGVIHRRHARFFTFRSDAQRVGAQLRRGSQPAHTLSADVKVEQMAAVARLIRQR